MFHLKKAFAESSLPAVPPAQTRPLGEPQLDARTAAYLEPATLPMRRPARKAARPHSARELWAAASAWLHSRRVPQPYSRLWVGFLCLLLLLLYLLVYALSAGSASTPYLIIAPAGEQSAPLMSGSFLAPPDASGELLLPIPLTGQ